MDVGFKGFFLLFSLFCATLLAGCVTSPGGQGTDVTAFASSIPEVKTFLDQYPNARIVAAFWDSTMVENSIASIRADCGAQFAVADYYKVTVTDPALSLTVWLDKSGQNVMCAVKSSTSTATPTNTKKGTITATETVMPPASATSTPNNDASGSCVAEGGTVAVGPNSPSCCAGLELVKPTGGSRGTLGTCEKPKPACVGVGKAVAVISPRPECCAGLVLKPYTGTMDGIAGTCEYPTTLINGKCGSSNNQLFDSKNKIGLETSMLCSAGGWNSTITGPDYGPWGWVCYGYNGGSNDTCTAGQDGACGPLNGKSFDSAPTGEWYDFCSLGKPSSVTPVSGSDSAWTWTCAGSLKGTPKTCSAKLATTKVAGACGSSDKKFFSSRSGIGPELSKFCSAGSSSRVVSGPDYGPFSWYCNSTSGGSNATCTAGQNGDCGNADGNYYWPSQFSAFGQWDLCSGGINSTPSGSDSWSWYCNGTNGGSNDSCSAKVLVEQPKVNGACGSASGTVLASKNNIGPENSKLCSAGGWNGTITGPDYGPWGWVCYGSNGGTNDSCVAGQNGACGNANTNYYWSSQFATFGQWDLCSTGKLGAVSGGTVGPWSWHCNGTSGGSNASCSAKVLTGSNAPVNGDCGSADKGVFASRNDINMQANTIECTAGTPSGYVTGPDYGPFTWFCNGTYGGSNATCTAGQNGACGNA
ncbi:MAG: hypothetical protein PHT59_06615, partial [Candidatus Omnitrophica bacterium]|nr:hypothetical protein [Candidatus Omnitrophota bacterium]